MSRSVHGRAIQGHGTDTVKPVDRYAGGMKRRRLLASAGAFGSVALAGCLEDAVPGVGDGGPSEERTTLQELELESLAVGASPGGPVRVAPPGSVVLLDFFATWCAPCKPQLDELARVSDAVGDAVAIRSITSETNRDAVASFWREHGGSWPVLLDPDVVATTAIGVEGLPTTVVVDETGTVAWRHAGLVTAGKVRDAIDAARE